MFCSMGFSVHKDKKLTKRYRELHAFVHLGPCFVLKHFNPLNETCVNGHVLKKDTENYTFESFPF
jgi:hypothetical protein